MKPILRYVLLAGIATLAVVMIYFYREYMGEDTTTENQTNPVINTRLNAIVTDTSSSMTQTNVAPSLKISYTDIDTKEAASFRMNYHAQPEIAIGDTLTKDKGEKILLVYKKSGTIVTVPIE